MVPVADGRNHGLYVGVGWGGSSWRLETDMALRLPKLVHLYIVPSANTLSLYSIRDLLSYPITMKVWQNMSMCEIEVIDRSP